MALYIERSIQLENNETIHYRELGDGDKVIVFIHGNMNSSVNWDVLMENLEGEEFRMIALDLRGMGHSSYVQPIYSIKDLSDDVKQLTDVLGLKAFTMIGWSAGGAVALQFASDYPDRVEKLVLLESASIKGFSIPKKNLFGKVKPSEFISSIDEIEKKVKPLLNAYNKKNRKFLKFFLNKVLYSVKKCPNDRIESYIDEMLLQRNLVDLNYSLIHFNISNEHNGVVDGNGKVKDIIAPTLVIQGALDKIVTMDMAKVNVNAIKNAKLAILSGCGHVPLVDDLSELKKTILDFLYS